MKITRLGALGIIGASLLLIATTGLTKLNEPLSIKELRILQTAAQHVLTAPTEEDVLAVRAYLSDGAQAGLQDEWIKALDILVDHRLEELDKEHALEQTSPDLVDPHKLTELLDQFAFSYDKGDITSFMTLFEVGAQTNKQYGKPVIQKAYNVLFNSTKYRKIVITNMEWKRFRNKAQGRGNFEVIIEDKKTGKKKSYAGKIIFHAKQNFNQMLISELYYSACQLDTL